MGNYAWLVCDDCPEYLWLGKIYESKTRPVELRSGVDGVPNSKLDLLNHVLWAFLGDHIRHRLIVADDVQFEQVMDVRGDQMIEIGGDSTRDLTFEEYLRRRTAKRATPPC